ncbi:L-Aspartase-like protein [Trichoderma chlorosporum]
MLNNLPSYLKFLPQWARKPYSAPVIIITPLSPTFAIPGQSEVARNIFDWLDDSQLALDIACNAIHHGGNLQATSITSVVEKTMLATQMIGKLFFAQCSEIIKPRLNKGLPPNLLGYLTHPVSLHVQSAEMHNQAVSSLALIAARCTGNAVEVLSMMSAIYSYILCQALELRALHPEYVKVAKPLVEQAALDTFGLIMMTSRPYTNPFGTV